MQNLLEVCCGLDVHKEVIVACLLSGLDEFKGWIMENGCRNVAMESTGVYWFSIYNVLESILYGEEQVNIIVANPHHMKNVPGKKTDVKDAQWIAILLRAGLLAPSYIPPKKVRELRDWCGTGTSSSKKWSAIKTALKSISSSAVLSCPRSYRIFLGWAVRCLSNGSVKKGR